MTSRIVYFRSIRNGLLEPSGCGVFACTCSSHRGVSDVPNEMGSPRDHRRTQLRRIASQSFAERRTDDAAVALSQPLSGTFLKHRSRNASPDRSIHEEEAHLVNSVIRYLLVVDKSKQVITKARLIKNVFANQGKQYARIMTKAKTLLSEIFGYRLVETEGSKYILVNEIPNELSVRPSGAEGSQRALLFVVLTHIFMHAGSCTEESLLDFLTHLGILFPDNRSHPYFGDAKHLVTEVFVSQKYLEKMVHEGNDSVSVEFKWGIRAEHEFSRRSALEFVSQVYSGRPISSWPLQYRTLIAQEKMNKSPAGTASNVSR